MEPVKLKSFSIPRVIASIFETAAISVAILPVLLLVPLLVQNAVNLPLMDQWYTPFAALLKAADGTLSFSDLIAQHNESRKFFPRLLFLGMAFLTGWDTRYEFLVIFLVACLIACQIYRLSQITIRGSEYKRLFLILLANLLIFSPVQSDNWLWGIQLITFVPIACITAGLIISYSNFKAKLKTLILVCLCTVSTYSYANGMLSWFIVFPSAIVISKLLSKQEFKTQRWLIIGGATGCTLNLVLYFYNYVKPFQTPSFSAVLLHPFDAVNFFLIFLGVSLSNQRLETARIVGLVLTILFGYVCFYTLRRAEDRRLLRCSIPWIAIGTYSCLSALVTTAGRVGWGLEVAMISRYTTFSLYLSISVVYLLSIVIAHALENCYIKRTRTKRTVEGLLLGLVVSFLVLHISTYLSYSRVMALNHRDRLHAKACLQWINFVEEKPTIEAVIYPNYDWIKPKINQLNQYHFLNPALIESPNILNLVATKEQHSPESHGYLDSVTRSSEKEIFVSGWAILPDRKQAADAVILTYETSQSEPKAFAIAEVMNESPDIAQHMKYEGYRSVRWSKTFPLEKLPKGETKLSAWAFDTEKRQAFPLANPKPFTR